MPPADLAALYFINDLSFSMESSAQFNVMVKRSCNRHHPVYLPRRNDVIVAIRNATSRVYLRAISDGEFVVDQWMHFSVMGICHTCSVNC